MKPVSLAVIVPFFQRDGGVLARALRSIAAQSLQPALIQIIDDESPAPVEKALVDLPADVRSRVRVTRQKNAGPGAARNAAIDAVAGQVEFIAFLDSDDEWPPWHVEHAVAALGLGFDVFFGNYQDVDDPVDGFARRAGFRSADHPTIGAIGHLHAFAGSMFTQILSANLIQLSTVVYRCSAAPQLRFRTEYRRAGEDMLFWLDLASRATRFCFSEEVEAKYGRGVNVYRGATRGEPGAFERIRDHIKYRKAVLADFDLDAMQRQLARRALSAARRHLAEEVLYRVRRGQPGIAQACRTQIGADPASAVWLVPNLCSCLLEWMRLRTAAARQRPRTR